MISQIIIIPSATKATATTKKGSTAKGTTKNSAKATAKTTLQPGIYKFGDIARMIPRVLPVPMVTSAPSDQEGDDTDYDSSVAYDDTEYTLRPWDAEEEYPEWSPTWDIQYDNIVLPVASTSNPNPNPTTSNRKTTLRTITRNQRNYYYYYNYPPPRQNRYFKTFSFASRFSRNRWFKG